MTPNPKALRAAFGRFMTGVTVVTCRDAAGAPVGFTANSFTSVSLDPPLVLVCPGTHLSSFDSFAATKTFGISILSDGQEGQSTLFASGSGDRFAGCAWDTPQGDSPLLQSRAAGFVCDTFQRVTAGDHLILIGRVTHFDDAALPGLGYGPDGYFTLAKERKAEAPRARQTHASVLLDDGEHVFLTEALDLPTFDVAPDESPLHAIKTGLAAQGIRANLSVVYAIYDEANGTRRIVFRAHPTETPPLTAHGIDSLSTLRLPDRALRSMLLRFRAEHHDQSFGFYLGSSEAGDILSTTKGKR